MDALLACHAQQTASTIQTPSHSGLPSLTGVKEGLERSCVQLTLIPGCSRDRSLASGSRGLRTSARDALARAMTRGIRQLQYPNLQYSGPHLDTISRHLRFPSARALGYIRSSTGRPCSVMGVSAQCNGS